MVLPPQTIDFSVSNEPGPAGFVGVVPSSSDEPNPAMDRIERPRTTDASS